MRDLLRTCVTRYLQHRRRYGLPKGQTRKSLVFPYMGISTLPPPIWWSRYVRVLHRKTSNNPLIYGLARKKMSQNFHALPVKPS